MKIRNYKTKVIGPVLLLIPMACMHLGDGHHDGDHHSSTYQQSQYSAHERMAESMMGQEWTIIDQGSEQEK